MIHLAHVGDSRCYRWREGILELLTHDHSLINDALEMRPNMDDAALAKLPANVVTRALGMEPAIRVSVRSHRMLAGDKYLLCSDGLSDTLDDELTADILAVPRPPDETVRALIARANEANANDNIGVVVVSVELAPNATAPARPSVHPPRKPPAIPKKSGDESDPEIVILGYDAESEMPDARAPMITVVPTDSADDSIIEILEDFSKNK
jgi:PPM family protein phosphatase